ncbi:PREDICTED: uncharacterized protein LOC104821807 [Tarenaya hassleriana]|uniref:uncharacterized protein LOC104821807 n=1 Tax=Tarenaya hassleriana TaxID=28532 RepID=UPI00053C7A62|nr:PREDICTED: uncharacterized protein LOC104821807 [Tarenaya hassleriana]
MGRAFLLIVAIFFFFTCMGITWSTPCRTTCGNIQINYPFGVDEGCGAPQLRGMFNCSSSTDLFFLTPSGSYKVQRIDYLKNRVAVYDPSMSTCSILQPHHDFKLTDLQNAVIRPSYDTVFALLNCSVDSPVLNHFRNLCFNFSGHSCSELYSSCSSFRVFNLTSSLYGNSTVHTTPYCCFTGYDTVRVMSMDILDCSHYTSVIDGGNMRDVAPFDWLYGIELSYSVPDVGCGHCQKSGGSCGFDTESEGFLCLCSAFNNATRDCGGAMAEQAGCHSNNIYYLTLILAMLMGFIYTVL